MYVYHLVWLCFMLCISGLMSGLRLLFCLCLFRYLLLLWFVIFLSSNLLTTIYFSKEIRMLVLELWWILPSSTTKLIQIARELNLSSRNSRLNLSNKNQEMLCLMFLKLWANGNTSKLFCACLLSNPEEISAFTESNMQLTILATVSAWITY